MDTAQTNAQREIGQVRANNEQLQKDNDSLRQELLAARVTPRPSHLFSVSSGSSAHSGLADQEQVKQLTADNNRIRGEREALRKDNEKLRRAIAEWKASARREKERHDAMVDRLLVSLKETEEKLKQSQGQPLILLPSHHEMGGHRPSLPAAEGRPSLPTTPGRMQGPPALSPYVSPSNRPGVVDSPQIPQLTPQRTASVTAMESDSQAGSGLEKQ